jgi:hypothetical protein
MVEDHVSAGLLRYSDRVKLVRSAIRLGIPRFHANLIVAMVQHEGEGTPLQSSPFIQPTSGSKIPWAIIAAAGMQLAILWSAWHLFHV